MDKNITVTIGLPFYNCENYLFNAISSILNQSFINFELLLSDDGSTDNSLQIAKSFNDSRIKIISDNQNKGIAFRINEQLDYALGKYFVRMDGDDIMFPSRLEKQINFLYNNLNIDILGSSVISIDESNNILGIRKSKLPLNAFDCFKHITFIHPSVIGKTTWFRKYGYNLHLNGVEDRDLWLRSFNNSNFALLDEPLLFYRDSTIFNYLKYEFRIKQLSLLLNSNKNKLKTYQYIYLFILIHFKLSIYYIFNNSIFIKYFIKSRNKNISYNDLNIYYNLLNIYNK
jgi:glycosyltransferase involved in cell wall biosynthesis